MIDFPTDDELKSRLMISDFSFEKENEENYAVLENLYGDGICIGPLGKESSDLQLECRGLYCRHSDAVISINLSRIKYDNGAYCSIKLTTEKGLSIFLDECDIDLARQFSAKVLGTRKKGFRYHYEECTCEDGCEHPCDFSEEFSIRGLKDYQKVIQTFFDEWEDLSLEAEYQLSEEVKVELFFQWRTLAEQHGVWFWTWDWYQEFKSQMTPFYCHFSL